MSKMKKMVSILLTLAMVIAMSITTFADGTPKYQIYQIFTGTVDEDNNLGNLAAGKNLKAGTDVAEAAAALEAATGSNQDKLAVITPYVDLASEAFMTTDAESVSEIPDGYYLVKNTDGYYAGQDGAATTYIALVADGSLTISPKAAKPTIDKQVLDETDDAEAGAVSGWGESADHAINESFQFKLIATLPVDSDLNDYAFYKLVFQDTMYEGITFESIESVTATNLKENATIAYTCSATAGQAGGSFNVSIKDLKQYVTTLQGTVVTVIYNAHLNENAVVNIEGAQAQANNFNKVNLKYSNNPNYKGSGSGSGEGGSGEGGSGEGGSGEGGSGEGGSGEGGSGSGSETPDTPDSEMGQTEYDYVFVLTYENDSTKMDVSVPSQKVPMAGVPFTLKNAEDQTIALYLKDGFYYPVGNSTNTPEEYILSGADGTFAIRGLDAGTYTLHEESNDVNAGYNLMEDLQIVIGATHIENNNKTSVDLTLNQTNDGQNELPNSKGARLPETGGMGTTLFYVFGSILVLGAGVLLVTKKRMAR